MISYIYQDMKQINMKPAKLNLDMYSNIKIDNDLFGLV